jgi:putative folate metabolism gamma-glutamate ligase
MIVTAHKTKKILPNDNILEILDSSLPKLKENSVVAISSKIISLCEGSVVQKSPEIKKVDLIKKECSKYINGKKLVKHGVFITITNGILNASGGIDDSNGKGIFILWPRDIRKTTNKIWNYLREKNNIKNLGIIITDSRSSPLRFGVLGVAIGWCGLKPLYNYHGEPDIWDTKLTGTHSNHLDALAISAVHEMGEGGEQTPLCVINDAHNVVFEDKELSKEEYQKSIASFDDDIYSPILKSAKWEDGEA